MVIANPPPSDLAIPWLELNQMIERAAQSAAVAGVTGKALTPFLLEQLRQLSGARTLVVNRSLIVRNATLAAEIALALAD